MIVRDNFLISAAQKGCFVWKMKNITKDREDQKEDSQLTFPGDYLLSIFWIMFIENWCFGDKICSLRYQFEASGARVFMRVIIMVMSWYCIVAQLV